MNDGERLQCMEVFGGSEPARRAVALGGLDAWVESIPHAQATAGGDVYYVSSCATGRITRLLVADVSGHGEAVASVARTLRDLMRRHVNHLDQRRFVARLNDAFVKRSTQGLFATAVVCTYFAPTRSLSLCNAGHPPPMRYRARDRWWQPLDRDPERPESGAVRNLPLGIVGDSDFEQFRVTMEVGDRVLIYTDAMIEACDARTAEPLGVEGVCDVLNAMPANAAHDAVVPALLAALRDRVGDGLSADDVTTLLFTPNPATEREGFITRLIAPLRWVRRTVAWRRDGTRRLPLPDLHPANLAGAVLPWCSRRWHA